uniref:Uncharacterized protein n=1 Tax=Cannabis sativa TaxID=3483 RepID=A0A803QRT7_CANSA
MSHHTKAPSSNRNVATPLAATKVTPMKFKIRDHRHHRRPSHPISCENREHPAPTSQSRGLVLHPACQGWGFSSPSHEAPPSDLLLLPVWGNRAPRVLVSTDRVALDSVVRLFPIRVKPAINQELAYRQIQGRAY